MRRTQASTNEFRGNSSPKGVPPESGYPTWGLIGGTLCIDFANTIDWRTSDAPKELLFSDAVLLHWARTVGALSDDEVGEGAELPVGALDWVCRFRGAVIAILDAATGSGEVTQALLEPLNRVIDASAGRRHLVAGPDGIVWEDALAEAAIADRLISRIALDTASLMTGGKLHRVRICDGPGCGWFFLDDSRAGNRRWCSMASCGNRSKARAHYRRGRSPA